MALRSAEDSATPDSLRGIDHISSHLVQVNANHTISAVKLWNRVQISGRRYQIAVPQTHDVARRISANSGGTSSQALCYVFSFSESTEHKICTIVCDSRSVIGMAARSDGRSNSGEERNRGTEQVSTEREQLTTGDSFTCDQARGDVTEIIDDKTDVDEGVRGLACRVRVVDGRVQDIGVAVPALRQLRLAPRPDPW